MQQARFPRWCPGAPPPSTGPTEGPFPLCHPFAGPTGASLLEASLLLAGRMQHPRLGSWRSSGWGFALGSPASALPAFLVAHGASHPAASLSPCHPGLCVSRGPPPLLAASLPGALRLCCLQQPGFRYTSLPPGLVGPASSQLRIHRSPVGFAPSSSATCSFAPSCEPRRSRQLGSGAPHAAGLPPFASPPRTSRAAPLPWASPLLSLIHI